MRKWAHLAISHFLKCGHLRLVELENVVIYKMTVEMGHLDKMDVGGTGHRYSLLLLLDFLAHEKLLKRLVGYFQSIIDSISKFYIIL